MIRKDMTNMHTEYTEDLEAQSTRKNSINIKLQLFSLRIFLVIYDVYLYNICVYLVLVFSLGAWSYLAQTREKTTNKILTANS